ncbi:hypothetical protein LCM00_01505 [Bacillus infantis]|uniref:hypothetical protein n=1 Tax=Bacillus infantis TaxID=324767 RepID=UPI001CD27063|nr:hypothetical protein [Bacillus infantis]MCA1038170.1 hypothetical protein [Bacillus infantis]
MMNLFAAVITVLLLLILIEESFIYGICRYMNGPGKFERAMAAKFKQAKQKLEEKI